MFQIPTRRQFVVHAGISDEFFDSFDEAAEHARMLRGPFTIETHDQTLDIRWLRDDDTRDDRERLTAAFRSLRKTHVTVLGRKCCSSCMWYEAGDAIKKRGGFVGFCVQSWDSWTRDRRNIDSVLHLQHQNAQPVIDALRANGLAASWDGDDSTTIAVEPASVVWCPQFDTTTDDHRPYYCSRCRGMRDAVSRHRRAIASDAFPHIVAGDHVPLSTMRIVRNVYTSSWTDWREGIRRQRDTERKEAATA